MDIKIPTPVLFRRGARESILARKMDDPIGEIQHQVEQREIRIRDGLRIHDIVVAIFVIHRSCAIHIHQ